MTINETSNVLAGAYADVYVAPSTADAPTAGDIDGAVTDLTGWTSSNMGWTHGPATYKRGQERIEVRVNQFAYPLDDRGGKKSMKVSFTLMEALHFGTIQNAFNLPASAITETSAGTGIPGTITLEEVLASDDPRQMIFAFEGADGNPIWCHIERAVFTQDTVEITVDPDNPKGIDVEVSALQPLDGGTPWTFIRQTADAS